MSHFYGTVQGNRGQGTRCGTKASGMDVTAASWNGAIETELYVDEKGRDCYVVREVFWCGRGQYRMIARGVIGEPQ